jgi:hypothetical protein
VNGHPEKPGPGPDSLPPEAVRHQWWWLLQQHLDDWQGLTEGWPVGLRAVRRDVLHLALIQAQETATLAGWPHPPAELLQHWRDLSDELSPQD